MKGTNTMKTYFYKVNHTIAKGILENGKRVYITINEDLDNGDYFDGITSGSFEEMIKPFKAETLDYYIVIEH